MVIFIHKHILTTMFALTHIHILCLVHTIEVLLQMMFIIYQTSIPYRENTKVMVCCMGP